MKHLLALYRVVISYVQAYGQAHVAVHQPTGHVVGATLWLESARAHPSILQEVQHGLMGALLRCNPRVLFNAIRFNESIYSERKRIMGNISYMYLWMTGVLPKHQGKGVGSQLMRYAFQDAGISGRTCYVETFKERNVAFYQKHGFKFISQKVLPNGPSFWTLNKK